MRGTIPVLLSLLLLAASAAVQAQSGDCFDYTINPDNTNTITITEYACTNMAMTIPSNINGLTVTGIGDNAFEDNTNLTSVTIPGNVTSIGQEAFSTCINLANVTMSNGVTSIGYGAFFGCYRLSSLTIPASVTSIGQQALLGTRLASVTIPGSVTSIGDSAFNDCASLTNANIVNGVTSIGQQAFLGTRLASVTIPASVTNIGDYAFDGTGLTSVYFTGNAPAADSTVFDNKATVYYLPGTIGWADFYFSNNTGLTPVLWNPLIQPGGANFGLRSNRFGFNITCTNSFTVVVEACTNLANRVWTPLQTLTLTNGSVYFSEPVQTNSSGRYYGLGFP